MINAQRHDIIFLYNYEKNTATSTIEIAAWNIDDIPLIEYIDVADDGGAEVDGTEELVDEGEIVGEDDIEGADEVTYEG